ncbi:hypothetical protein L1887_31850 [Cichorium endivia]|nr:hypothetical protein L1887_31850 [Cichorium endivia]
MNKIRGLHHILSSFYSAYCSCVSSLHLILVNNCRESIWPGLQGGAGHPSPKDGGFRLDGAKEVVVDVPDNWSGRIWARQGCYFDGNGTGRCVTGGCAGQLHCQGTCGEPPATMVEMTFGFYDRRFNLVPQLKHEKILGGASASPTTEKIHDVFKPTGTQRKKKKHSNNTQSLNIIIFINSYPDTQSLNIIIFINSYPVSHVSPPTSTPSLPIQIPQSLNSFPPWHRHRLHQTLRLHIHPQPAAPHLSPPIHAMRSLQGRVICTTNDKTMNVEVTRLAPHPKYKRRVGKKKKFQAYDPENQFQIGDLVQLEKCKPISKKKTFLAVSVPKRTAHKQPKEVTTHDLGIPTIERFLSGELNWFSKANRRLRPTIRFRLRKMITQFSKTTIRYNNDGQRGSRNGKTSAPTEPSSPRIITFDMGRQILIRRIEPVFRRQTAVFVRRSGSDCGK